MSQNQRNIQTFGYTGCQRDEIAGTYYAQAREYKAESGRFLARDRVKGTIIFPFTFNEYIYCYNNGMLYLDYDGCEYVL
ncbi:RHS repeat-associated core domain-containing protein [Faecalimonas sp.]